MRPSPVTSAYQARQRTLRALTYRDVIAAWSLLDLEKLDDSFPKFAAAVSVSVLSRRRVSERLAREYLARLRTTAGVGGRPPAVASPVLDASLFLAVLRTASVVSIKSAMTARRPLEMASRNALVNALGTADKAVNAAARDVIRASVGSDPKSRGWTRVTSGGCDWCRGMTGPVLPGSVEMAAHPHCGCTPQPVFA